MIGAIKGFFVIIVTAAILIACALAVFISLARADNGYEYEISGINPATGERVAGTMIDDTRNGTVCGVVLDRLDRVPVAGVWSGKGMARLKGHGRTYNVEVVE